MLKYLYLLAFFGATLVTVLTLICCYCCKEQEVHDQAKVLYYLNVAPDGQNLAQNDRKKLLGNAIPITEKDEEHDPSS